MVGVKGGGGRVGSSALRGRGGGYEGGGGVKGGGGRVKGWWSQV